MAAFSAQFHTLPEVDHLARIEILCEGRPCGVIEGLPGQQGSLRIYHAVADDRGVIDPSAARRALRLYGDYTTKARMTPGSHPNIDRLLRLVETGQNLRLLLSPCQPGNTAPEATATIAPSREIAGDASP